MKIAILTIGDELLNGDLTDSNTATIARALAEESLCVSKAVTIGDSEAEITATLQRLVSSCDAVIVTGGLGPTEDDLTSRAAAKAFNRPLSLNCEALKQIQARFRFMKREMHPRNEKQALLPAKSSVITNRNGTAPGFHLQQEQVQIFFMPGVPHEMKAMLDAYVIPNLLQTFPELPSQARRIITVFGLAEPAVEDLILKKGLPDGVELAFNVEFSMVHVKLRAEGENALQKVNRAELSVREALGDYIVGIDDETLAFTTAKILTTAGLTLSLAESCTGGLIAKLLTDQPGSSAFLERAVVSYANSAKIDCLNVSGELIERYGAVSAECANAMAEGVYTSSGTDIALAVTGIAGPDGGTEEKPVGTVFMAMISRWGERVERLQLTGSRQQVRLRTAYMAMDWIRRLVINRPQEKDEL